ncbi:hypothetical protein WME94_06110 [Sorangium sp. So ce429]
MLSPGWPAAEFDNRRRSHGYADESAFPIMLDHVRNEFPFPEHAKAACSIDCGPQLVKNGLHAVHHQPFATGREFSDRSAATCLDMLVASPRIDSAPVQSAYQCLFRSARSADERGAARRKSASLSATRRKSASLETPPRRRLDAELRFRWAAAGIGEAAMLSCT